MERVEMALAYKGKKFDYTEIEYGDRSRIRKISGQDLIPVLELDGDVIVDSMEIIQRLEEKFPDKPLFPTEPARLAEMNIFIDWFNKVWKVPPNAIEAEMGKEKEADLGKIEAWGKETTSHLEIFEGMLSGRDFLMGDQFSAADAAAHPFLRCSAIHDREDPYLFHKILAKHQPLGENHPNLRRWIENLEKEYRPS